MTTRGARRSVSVSIVQMSECESSEIYPIVSMPCSVVCAYNQQSLLCLCAATTLLQRFSTRVELACCKTLAILGSRARATRGRHRRESLGASWGSRFTPPRRTMVNGTVITLYLMRSGPSCADALDGCTANIAKAAAAFGAQRDGINDALAGTPYNAVDIKPGCRLTLDDGQSVRLRDAYSDPGLTTYGRDRSRAAGRELRRRVEPDLSFVPCYGGRASRQRPRFLL